MNAVPPSDVSSVYAGNNKLSVCGTGTATTSKPDDMISKIEFYIGVDTAAPTPDSTLTVYIGYNDANSPIFLQALVGGTFLGNPSSTLYNGNDLVTGAGFTLSEGTANGENVKPITMCYRLPYVQTWLATKNDLTLTVKAYAFTTSTAFATSIIDMLHVSGTSSVFM